MFFTFRSKVIRGQIRKSHKTLLFLGFFLSDSREFIRIICGVRVTKIVFYFKVKGHLRSISGQIVKSLKPLLLLGFCLIQASVD